jgi:hypothetical protein
MSIDWTDWFEILVPETLISESQVHLSNNRTTAHARDSADNELACVSNQAREEADAAWPLGRPHHSRCWGQRRLLGHSRLIVLSNR